MRTALWAGLGLAVSDLAPSWLQRDGTDCLRDGKNGEERGGTGEQQSELVKRGGTRAGGVKERGSAVAKREPFD